MKPDTDQDPKGKKKLTRKLSQVLQYTFHRCYDKTQKMNDNEKTFSVKNHSLTLWLFQFSFHLMVPDPHPQQGSSVDPRDFPKVDPDPKHWFNVVNGRVFACVY